MHARGFLAARRQHDDRQAARLVPPQSGADFDPGYARQHPIENDEIGRRLGESQFGVVAAMRALDEIAFGLQIVDEQGGNVGIVFDDGDARRGG